ncbi:MAG: hypothetical protein M3O84_09095 [Actinomycetota bacterium]|nr:hypothetical protein [Actinomycetota bacterium]
MEEDKAATHVDDSAWADEALERELYWAEQRTTRGPTVHSIAELREALREFEALMLDDERNMYPRAEPNLAGGTKWRRALKLRVYRFLRPVTRRYDRLIGELAGLTLSLAERLRESEAEVARLRAGRGRNEPPGGGEQG